MARGAVSRRRGRAGVFEIAGFRTGFLAEGRGLVPLLRRRYRAFISTAVPGMSFDVSSAPGRPLPFRPAVIEKDGNLSLRRGDFSGSLEIVSGRGSLSAAPNEQCLDAFLRSLVSALLLRSGGLMLHSAGVVKKGRAYVFPGVSGAGKSTLSRLAAGAGFEVISDEINLLRPGKSGWRAYGSPFWGEMRSAGRRGSWPLGGVLLPKKAGSHWLLPCGRGETLKVLLRCLVNFERSGAASARALGGALALLKVPCRRLGFSRKDAGFMELI